MKMNKVREQISQAFLESLKENELPWQKGWLTERPYNAASNTEYRGVNSFCLSYAAEQKGYSDPRWCTFKQAQDKGWKVKKGEHGTQVEFWSMYDTETKKKLTVRESNLLKKELGEDFYERVKPISSVYTVFNGEQIEGIPERKRTHEPPKSEELIRKRDTLIRNMGFTFHEGGDRAFYRPGDDSVTLPQMEQFRSIYDYMSVFLHESGHATGHGSRLDRDLSGGFGSEKYAREELRAEIASAFTSQELGLGEVAAEHMDNHKAYIQSWIDVLEKEPQELFAAIRDAEKISDYLIEKGGFLPEKQQRAELDMQKQQYVTEHQRNLEMGEERLIPVSENLAGKLWDEECSLYTREAKKSHRINSRSELYEAGKEKTIYVHEEEFSGCLKKAFFPTVTCEWSEHDCFDDGKTYLVSEFSSKMANADQEWCKHNCGGEENAMGYAKVKFQVNLSVNGDKIVERQDIGDGDGSMLEFLRKTGGIQYQRAVEQLEEACTLEKDFINYQKKLNGIFEQKEGNLPQLEHAMGNCQDQILSTLQKQLSRERGRQGAAKPVNRHLERVTRGVQI